MRLKIIHSLSTLLVISLLCSCSSSQKLHKALSHDLNSKTFDQSFTGFALYDVEKKEFVLEQNSNKYFTPASNIKLLTFYAAINVLEDSIPGIRYVSTPDSLIFWGTGDPSFLNPNLPESRVLNFLKSSPKDLYLANSPANIPPLGPGWAWDDYNDYYSAERSQFPVYGNVVNFKWNLGDSIPISKPKYFSEHIKRNNNPSHVIQRNVNSNTFDYNSAMLKENLEVDIPFKTSVELTAKLLSDTLQKPVTLIIKPSYLQKKDVKTVYSIVTDSLYKEMLQESDNFIAEQLLLLISEKVSDTLSTSLAIDHIQSTYFQDLPDDIKWVDGSGLSRYNLVTPRTLVSILERIIHKLPKEKLFQLLPAGGESGTLKDWYLGEEPYIFAKTGSLRNNHSLSGYLKTKSGKIMIFSFMNNNYVTPSSKIKKAMENILLEIRNSY